MIRVTVLLVIAASLAGHSQAIGELPQRIVLPTYPRVAIGKEIEGVFTLELRIRASGEVVQVNVLDEKYSLRRPDPDDPSVLLRPLRNAILQWRFAPGNDRTKRLLARFRLLPQTTDTSNDIAVFEAPDSVLIQHRMMLYR